MGCSSSKVGQKPLGPEDDSIKDPENEKRREPSAEESRAALPVQQSAEGTKGKSGGARQEGGSTRQTKAHEEVEGKTITDESGLQMRTPRRSDDRSLHSAAKRGDLPLVLTLLANTSGIGPPTGSEENATNSKGGYGPTATAPTTPCASIDERGMWGNTPLLVATQYAHAHVALVLINGGADLSVENERHATALHYCCAEGLIDVGRALLSSKVDVDPPSAAVHHPGIDGGRTVPLTPLSAAAIGGHAEFVQLLVEAGAEVDRRVPPQGPNLQQPKEGQSCEDNTGMTPLMGAARYGHTDTCLVLIDNGARLLAKDSDSRTVLMHAIQGRHEQTAQALLDAARVAGLERCLSEAGESSGGGLTPLQFACSEKLSWVVKALLVAGADTEARDSTGATALLRSCRTGSVACARELLSRRADPLAADNEGDTPLLATRSNENATNSTELLELMEAAAAAVGAPVEKRQAGEHLQNDAGAVQVVRGTVSVDPNDDEQEKNNTNGTELLELVEAAVATVEAPVEERQDGEHPQNDAEAVRVIGGTASDDPNDDKQEKNTTNGTERLELAEAAIAAVEAPVEERQAGEHPQDDAAAIRIIGGTVSDDPNDDELKEEKEEDVLLVSDWKQEDEFDKGEVWGGVIPNAANTGSNHSIDDRDAHGIQPETVVASSIARIDDDEDDDVLLAGDFELETAGEGSRLMVPSIRERKGCDEVPVKPSSGSQSIADEQSERERRQASIGISTGKEAERCDRPQASGDAVAAEAVGDMVAAATLRAATPNDLPLDG